MKVLLSDGHLVEDWSSREWRPFERILRWMAAKAGEATVDEVVALYMHHPDMGAAELEELIAIALRREAA